MGVRNKKCRKATPNTIKGFARLKQYKAVDAFCGPGGISLGLTKAGFTPVFAFDCNEKAINTYNNNLGSHGIVADAKTLNGKEVLKQCRIKRGELDLFAGGPPCQGFSKQKKGAHLGDSRNNLVSEYIRLAQELGPRIFLFENVAIFGQKRGKKYVKNMKEMLNEYVLYPHFYNSANYGLAQTRERFIIIGVRQDLGTSFNVPNPTATKWKTVGEELSEFPEPPADYTEHPRYHNHQNARVTELNIKRFSFVPQGGGWQDIPREYQLECHKNTDTTKGGWPDVYGRLEWDGQCPTITGGFDSFTRGRYGHPLQDRPLTPREAAKIQGFPNSFTFYGTRADVRSQIGNAVPPPLAEAIGVEIAKSLLIADKIICDDLSYADDTQKRLADELAN